MISEEQRARNRASKAKHYATNRKLMLARAKEHAKANPEARRKALKKYYAANVEKLHRRKLKYRYGLTNEQYDEMLLVQNGVCAICGQTDKRKRLAVDHCHDTGRIRGLLCSQCNVAIGALHNQDLLDNAAEYLCRR